MSKFNLVKLEQRLLFDAAAAAAVADGAAAAAQADASADAAELTATETPNGDILEVKKDDQSSEQSESKLSKENEQETQEKSEEKEPPVQLLVVSSDVQNYQTLGDAASDATIVVTYDANQVTLSDLALEIREATEGLALDSIAFVNHGDVGEFALNNDLVVNSETLGKDANLQQFFKEVGSLIKDGGRVDLLACNLAEDGVELLQLIDQFIESGAEGNSLSVSASTDITGNTEQGGDWHLEVGNIDALTYFNESELNAWKGSLAIFTVTNNNNAGAGSYRQAIIDANAAVGADTINFDATYNIGITSQLPQITDSVTINGNDSTIDGNDLAGTGTGIRFTTNSPGLTLEVNDFNVHDFRARGADIRFATNVEITDSSFTDNRSDGIRVRNTTTATFEGITSTDNNRHGILSRNVTTFTLDESASNMSNISDNGGNHEGIDLRNSTTVTIQNSLINDNNRDGIDLRNSSDVTIKDNTINGNNRDGLLIDNVDTFDFDGNTVNNNNRDGLDLNRSDDTTITNSTFEGNSENGIEVDRSSMGTISLNTIGDNSDNGIEFITTTDFEIKENNIGLESDGITANGNTNNGVYLGSDSDSNTITTNNISSNGMNGIVVTGSELNVITKNNIGFANDGITSRGNTLDGVFVTGSSDTTSITENNIGNNSGDGITINNSDSTTIDKNNIGIASDGTTAAGNGAHGINYINGDSGMITSNIIVDNTNDGLSMSSNSDMNTISNNSIGVKADGVTPLGNGDDGISLNGSDTNTISENVIVANGQSGTGNGITLVNSESNSIEGNFIGITTTDVTLGNADNGIELDTASDFNTIGGVLATDRNIISGNGASGILINGADNLSILNNYIGTSSDGLIDKGNIEHGIHMASTMSDSTIGSTVLSQINLISGNDKSGIFLEGGVLNDSFIRANYIGTDITGLVALPNGEYGIHSSSVEVTGTGGVVGDASGGGVRVLISGNTKSGIFLENLNGNFPVVGALIGTDATGLAALANGEHGIHFSNSRNVEIGGTTAAETNVISGNIMNGVFMEAGSSNNTISRSLIGTDSTGSVALGNGEEGIKITDSGNANIIGLVSGGWNVISGNTNNGVYITGETTNTDIFNNFIGTNSAGDAAIANGKNGILIDDGSNNNDIGESTGRGNTISGNTENGIYITEGSDNTQIFNNVIGTNSAGDAAIANGQNGILIDADSDGTDIGNDTGRGNLISGNTLNGVVLDDQVSGTIIYNNKIGTDITGQLALGNGENGVVISDNSIDNSVGDSGDRGNLISANTLNGIKISDQSNSNDVFNNIIGLDVDGDTDLGNGANGVLVEMNSDSNIIGTATGHGNVISGNTLNGVFIDDGSDSNQVRNNFIGTNSLGTVAIGNDGNGVFINNESDSNFIGLSGDNENVISGNKLNGVAIADDSDDNRVVNSHIGVNAAGTSALANTLNGVSIIEGSDRTIIGNSGDFNNVISSNLLSGIYINASEQTSIYNSAIGTDLTRTVALGNGEHGISLDNGSNRTVIGLPFGSARNVISSNTLHGIFINNQSNDSIINNNRIGTDESGSLDLGNTLDGIRVNDSDRTIIGSFADNVISGNDQYGVAIIDGDSNRIIDNTIGLNAAETADLGNTLDGVFIQNSTNTDVGAASDGNRISGNDQNGVSVIDSDTTSIVANRIGTNSGGSTDFGNTLNGVSVSNSTNTDIGGTSTTLRNIISGNDDNGVLITNSSDSTSVLGNRIGTNSSGNAALANGGNGVEVNGSTNTDIGDGTSDGRNIISGNTENGVAIIDSDTTAISENRIGTNAAGGSDLGNTLDGVLISNSTNSVVSLNTISGNDDNGVLITNSSDSTSLLGNRIGTNSSGSAVLANGGNGVEVNGVTNTDIGDGTEVGQNIISGNTENGVSIIDSDATTLSNNRMGTNAGGGSDLGNTLNGVSISNSTNSTIENNLISGNDQNGLFIGDSSTNTDVFGNFIGTNAAGTAALANSENGIEVNQSTMTAIGDGTSARQNVISGNGENGIYFQNSANNNTVQGNAIGTDSSGLIAIGNIDNGIRITDSSLNLIGGLSTSLGNIIAHNGGSGVWVESGEFNGILTNSIFLNGELGIDLVDKGVDPNDFMDPDLLANLQQNYPVLTYAIPYGSSDTLLGGIINTLPNLTFTLQFFRNIIPDASGFGEGRVFVTSTQVTTDGSGDGSFEVIISDTGLGHFISATATDPFNNTSEFSANIQVGIIQFPTEKNPEYDFPFFFLKPRVDDVPLDLMAEQGSPWGFLGIDFRNQMTSTGDNIGFRWLVPYQNFVSDEMIQRPVPSTLYVDDDRFDRVTAALDVASEVLGIPQETAAVHDSITEVAIEGLSLDQKVAN